MFQIYRRPGSRSWWVSFTVNGDRVRRSLGTDDEDTARLLAADQHKRALIGPITGAKETITLDQAMGRYLVEHAQYQASFVTTQHQAKALLRIVKRGTPLSALDDAKVAGFVAKRRGEQARRGKTSRRGRGSVQMDRLVSNATVNREVELLRRVMNRAAKKWKYDVAIVDWQDHLLEESDGNTRWLTADQFQRVIDQAAAHMRPALVAAICTGLRAGNVMRLDWSEIDLGARLITVRVKSRKPGGKVLTIPIAQPLLLELANLRPKESGRVFLYKGRPLKTDMRRAFLAALGRAGMPGRFTWHDLRHTAASWMRQRKVPIETIKEILGHSDIRLTMRYAHIGADSHVDAVEAVAKVFSGTPVAQPALKKVAND